MEKEAFPFWGAQASLSLPEAGAERSQAPAREVCILAESALVSELMA
jgi:hypothetical protein